MRFLNFTPQEMRALLFLLIALLIGSGISIYKRYHSNFAPQLIFKQPPGALENQGEFSEAESQIQSYVQDTSREISKSSISSPIPSPRTKNRIASIPGSSLERRIDLNSASASELELLPQIGPVLSRRIIDYRTTKGKFQRIEDLMKVSGIGSKTLEQIRDLITVR